jgi:uncharacterized protein (TIGR03067 family)
MSRFAAIVVCLGAATGLVPAQGDKAAKIEGTWIATVIINDGEKVSEANVKQAKLTVIFEDGRYRVVKGGNEVESGKYTSDASKKPATIDLAIVEIKGDDKGKVQLGVYKIEDDVLTIAMTPAGSKERPKDFAPLAKGEITVLKRVK